MPRVHKRKPSSRNYKSYSEEQLLNALKECRSKAISMKDISKIYNIPIRTLRNKLKGVHKKAHGRPQALHSDLEDSIAQHLLSCAEFGMPLETTDIRYMAKAILDRNKEKHPIFKNNLPGIDWVRGFLSRHKELTLRNCQNIKRSRAEVLPEEIERYFKNLEKSVEGVNPENILNFDETNLSDDPGNKKCVFRRGVKYPERVINFSKGNISVMFAGTASGELLPPYVVYKAEHMWQSWCERGPAGSRYGRSKNGWMDTMNFEEWFLTIVVPWARKREGKKVIIGDNLSSHFSHKVINECQKMNILFVLLPPNSTDKCQPLDVSLFAPMKRVWRKQLDTYRQKFPSSSSLDKSFFPRMLNQLLSDMKDSIGDNLVSGFRACGIYPLDAQKVLKKLPTAADPPQPGPQSHAVSPAFLEYLQQFRYSPGDTASNSKQKRKRIPVSPGKSVVADHLVTKQSSIVSNLAGTRFTPISPQPSTSADVNTSDSNLSSDHNVTFSDSGSDEEWLPKTKIKKTFA